MISQKLLRVMIMDTDFYARMAIVGLIVRDERTMLWGEAETPSMALSLKGQQHPKVAILEADYQGQQPALDAFIRKLLIRHPGLIIICLARRFDPQLAQIALENGARGFILKSDIRWGLVAAIVHACRGQFILTPGAEPVILDHLKESHLPAESLPAWQPNPNLSPQRLLTILLRVMFGMQARAAAREMNVTEQTIEKYTHVTYGLLQNSNWAAFEDFDNLDLDSLSSEERGFLWYTALPRKGK